MALTGVNNIGEIDRSVIAGDGNRDRPDGTTKPAAKPPDVCHESVQTDVDRWVGNVDSCKGGWG